MYIKCCVINCASLRKDVNLHMFPKSEIGLRKWLDSINSERLRSLSFKDLRKQFVCRKHFEERLLASPRDRARLRAGAYPTLFTAKEISSGIPEKSSILHEVNREHDYMIQRQHEDHTYCKEEVVAKRSKIESEIIVESPETLDIEIHHVSCPSQSASASVCKRTRYSDVSPKMSSKVLKCSNCNIVICEVLAFIQNKVDMMNEDSLVQICTSSFSVEDIENAKSLLFESVPATKLKIARKREGHSKRDLHDVIAVFKETAPEEIPIFVARALQKLPPLTFTVKWKVKGY